MVYLSSCSPSNYSLSEDDEAFKCVSAGKQPYCWPRNGVRICGGGEQSLTFYWSTPFYRENASLYISFGDQPQETWQGPFDLSTSEASSAQLKDYEKYAQSAHNGTFAGEKILRVTLHENWPYLDTLASAVHPGPTLILEAPRASMTAAPSSSASAGSYSSGNDDGKLIGIILGSCIGGVALIALLYFCCGRCCGGCCGFAGRSENERIKRLEARRLQSDGESQIDTDMKVAQKAVPKVSLPKCPEQSCSVRPGGKWALDMPKRASRPVSSASDEIRAIHVVEEQRVEERRVEEERQEIARVDVQPPAYEAAPPKYMP